MKESLKRPGIKIALRLMILAGLAAAFFLMNVNAGPLSQMDEIGGWGLRRLYLVLASGMLFVALASTAFFRSTWGTYALRMMFLVLGAVMRFYAMDSYSPYFVENLSPVIKALSGGLAQGAAQGNAYTPLTLTLLYVLQKLPIFPMYLVKLLSIGGDLLLAQICCRGMEKYKGEIAGSVMLFFVLFCPSLFLGGAYGGTPDSLPLVCAALALYFAWEKKGLLAGIAFGAGYALYPAMLMILPALGLVAGKDAGRRMALAAPVSGVVLSIPALLLGMPFSKALAALTLRGRNPGYLFKNNASFYNFFAQPRMEDIPEYHLLRHIEGIEAGEMTELYTGATIPMLRTVGFIVFAVVFCALCITLYRKRTQLQAHAVTVLALFALTGALLLPGGDAGGFLLADGCILLYAMNRRGGWRVAFLSLGASCIAMIAFVTGAATLPLWGAMLMQFVVVFALLRDLARALSIGEALAQPVAPSRI